jgi:hypothetical protein
MSSFMDCDNPVISQSLLSTDEATTKDAKTVVKNESHGALKMAPMLAPIQSQISDWIIYPPLPPMLVPSQAPMLVPTQPQPPSQVPPVSDKLLIPIEEFTPEYVNCYFGFEVNECKYKKMYQLHLIWHEFYAANIASFVFSGSLNIWGFHSVRVINRETWDTRILETAKKMARNLHGKPASRHIQSIYEIIKYNGMCVEKTHGLYTHGDKKALSQNNYFFDRCAFEKMKKRAKGW